MKQGRRSREDEAEDERQRSNWSMLVIKAVATQPISRGCLN